MSDTTSLEVVRHEQDGRVLSGVGVSEDSLASTMERFAPETPAAVPEAPAVDAAAAPPVVEEKKPRGAKRFDQLTAEREEFRRLADAEKKRADDIAAQLEAFKRQPAPSQTPPPVSQQAPAESAAPSMPDEITSFDKYLAAHPTADYETYRDARDDWRQQHIVSPKFDATIRTRIEADQASRSLQARVADVRSEAMKVYPDFDAVMGQPHAQAPLGEQKFTYILSLPNAHHVAYALAKDPALYQKAVTANPIEFGQLIAAVAPPSSVASPASTGRVGSVPPPAPYQPVGSGSKTTAPTSAEATKGGYDFDKSGYRERRAAERGVTRRR